MNQTHDHNPGITDEGLFWTMIAGPETTVWSAPRAQMCATDLWLPDMGNLGNAIARGPMTPSTVSFHALWDAHHGRPNLDRNVEERYRFLFRLAEGLVTFTATEPNVAFRSIMTDEPQETLYAAIGVEANGQFFN